MGYGAAGLRLTPEGRSALTSGRSITMAAAGRGASWWPVTLRAGLQDGAPRCPRSAGY